MENQRQWSEWQTVLAKFSLTINVIFQFSQNMTDSQNKFFYDYEECCKEIFFQ